MTIRLGQDREDQERTEHERGSWFRDTERKTWFVFSFELAALLRCLSWLPRDTGDAFVNINGISLLSYVHVISRK